MITKLVTQESAVPDGTYSGLWGGYIVDFTYNGDKYRADTKNGVRGMNIPCNITIKDNEVIKVST